MNLGRGNHGYLALVLLDTDYASILNMALFMPLTCLPALTIPAMAIPIQALELKNKHNK